MTPIKLGVIGAGMWGTVHMNTIRETGRAEIAWVCDISPQALVRAQETFDIPNSTEDYRDVLADPAVEAVIIASPPFTHAAMAVDILRAGKHLLLEKPMARSESEIVQILDEVERHPELVVLEGSCRHARLNPKYHFIKSMIESGKLGEIYHIAHRHLGQGTFIEYNPDALWSMSRELAGGGPFIDWGEYDFSFHMGVLGDAPELVSVRDARMVGNLRDLGSKAPIVDVEMHGYALLEFDTGMTYFYERGAGVHNESRNETRIYGTRGGLHFYYTTWEPATVTHFYGDASPENEEFEVDMSEHPRHDNLAFINHFIDCLEGKATPLMPVALAAKHMRMLLQIYGVEVGRDGI
jgi:predicted dehydrogenase